MEPHTLQNLKNQKSMDKFQTGHMLILVKENVKRTSSVRDLRLSQRCCWRFKYSGMLRFVDRWIVLDVSKVRSAFMYGTKQYTALKKT
jgi:hypothetical protein